MRHNESPHFPEVQFFLIHLLEALLELLLSFPNNLTDTEEATVELQSLHLYQLIFSPLGV